MSSTEATPSLDVTDGSETMNDFSFENNQRKYFTKVINNKLILKNK